MCEVFVVVTTPFDDVYHAELCKSFCQELLAFATKMEIFRGTFAQVLLLHLLKYS